MSKPHWSLIASACLMAGTLAACDNEAGDAAQDDASNAEPAPTLEGVLSRDFAGEEIPAMEVVAPSGTALDLGEMRGRPVLLNLWATWCVPCVVEMPMLDELAGEYDGRLRVVTVNEDTRPEKVPQFFEERKIANLPQWLDDKGDLAITFGGGVTLPLTVLYDARGQEIWRMIGGYDWSSEEARALVDEAFAETADRSN